MPRKTILSVTSKISALLTLSIIFTSTALAQMPHTFRGTPDGAMPEGRLVSDPAGNLYGTTEIGGAYGNGSIYELMATGGERILYSFTGAADGGYPSGKMVRDDNGDLIGTASGGGSLGGNCAFLTGCGVVWMLSPGGKLRVLYTFTGGADGAAPLGGLVRGPNGVFHGAAEYGGSTAGPCEAQNDSQFGCGVVFQINGDGAYTVWHTFTGASDGQFPIAPLALDASGNLYGTTLYGGGSTTAVCTSQEYKGCGVVFKVDASGHESVVYAFNGTPDAAWPIENDVTLDAADNLYGSTSGGGAFQYGAVYKIDSTGTESVLHSFTGGSDGAIPRSGLLLDAKGNLYGTTTSGPTITDQCDSATCGVVFQLTPAGTETVLYKFPGNYDPIGDLLLDQGFLYGTTMGGGSHNDGLVFKIKP
jgi:uncharacterized repeat protein (TIGR03803 family)